MEQNTCFIKENLIELTKKIYFITLLFPKKEPLRYKIRELADEILIKALKILLRKTKEEIPRLLDDLEVLDCFFEIVKSQNWVIPQESLKLKEQYSKLKEELVFQQRLGTMLNEIELLKDIKAEKSTKRDSSQILVLEGKEEKKEIIIPERQKKILEILKEKGESQVWQVKKVFPTISKRTIRRDFENLLTNGLIERLGEKNNTLYRIIK